MDWSRERGGSTYDVDWPIKCDILTNQSTISGVSGDQPNFEVHV
jgi:hypothetical protein